MTVLIKGGDNLGDTVRNYFYTIGIGHREGKHEDRKTYFQSRIWGHFKNGAGAMIMDVRKENSKSREGKWAWQTPTWQGNEFGMGKTIPEINAYGGKLRFWYWPLSQFSNPYGRTKDGLEKYARDMRHLEDVKDVAQQIAKSRLPVVILCSCGQAYKNGRIYCHRTVLAKEFLSILLHGWGVIHLPTD